MEKEKLMKDVKWAFRTGIELQKELTSRNETDNSVRGFVYRLINLSSVGDVPQFMDTILRMYAGHGLAIPAVFKDCYESEEAFQAIAHSFILGLKNDNKENTKGEGNNE